MKKLLILSVLLSLLPAFILVNAVLSFAGEAQQDIPVKDTVTMVDLGAKSCIPCKMMAPILEELKVEYQGRAAIIFIDVLEDPSQGKRFGVMSIPTQIFYDRHGAEIYRHVGFFAKKDMKKWLDMLIERE